MTGLVLWLTLNAGAADTLVKAQVGDVSIKLPQSKDWKSEETAEANGKTKAVSSADGDRRSTSASSRSTRGVTQRSASSSCSRRSGPKGTKRPRSAGSPRTRR